MHGRFLARHVGLVHLKAHDLIGLQDHVVKGGSGGNHGSAHVRLHTEVSDDGPLVVVDELLDTVLQLVPGHHAQRLDAVSLGKLAEVGVVRVRHQVALVEVNGLPDVDHLLLKVVHDRNLHRHVVLRQRPQVLARHQERRVAVDGDDRLVRLRDLRADGVRHADAHGAQRPAGHHPAGPLPGHELRAHHLVVADAGGPDAVLGAVHLLQVLVHLVHNLLHLEVLGVLVGDPLEGVLRLVRRHRRKPVLARLLGQAGQDVAERRSGVAQHGEGGLDHLADLLVLDLKLDDPALAVALRLAGLTGILVEAAGGAVVEAVAEGDDQVGLLHGVVRVRRAVHAQHAERQVVFLVDEAERVDRRRARDVQLHHGPHLLPRVVRALARHDDRTLRVVDEADDLVEVGDVRSADLRWLDGGHQVGHVLVAGVRVERLHHDVLRQVQEHGALLA
eukprot:Rhum_TRINITY_DN15065_c9_g2::Rhum_TRINITY_DN15065_c9_g2_i1::g.137266::m.137266